MACSQAKGVCPGHPPMARSILRAKKEQLLYVEPEHSEQDASMTAWFGSKGTTGPSQAIISCMPPHHTYVETHLGGGAIMARKPPAQRSIGIDRNRQAGKRFRCDYPVDLHHGCAHRFLSEFDFDGHELVYSDPPYVQSTRKSGHRYRFDYTDTDHITPLNILKTLPCPVMVSGYPSRLHDEHLEGWQSLEVQVNNQAGIVTKKLWFNFVPGRPHWHTCAGRNFTDRQRIKRNAASWARRYRKMPAGERLAVLAAVMAVGAE